MYTYVHECVQIRVCICDCICIVGDIVCACGCLCLYGVFVLAIIWLFEFMACFVHAVMFVRVYLYLPL